MILNLNINNISFNSFNYSLYSIILYSCISCTLPLLLDGFISLHLPYNIIISRLLLYLSILIPNLIIILFNLIYNDNNNNNNNQNNNSDNDNHNMLIKITLCSIFSRQILSIGDMLSVFNNNILYFNRIKLISVIIGVIVYSTAPLYYFLPDYQNLIMLIYIIGGRISLTGIIFMCSYYIWKVIHLPVISSLEKYCAIIAATIIFGMIVRGIITISFNIAGPKLSFTVLIFKTLIDTVSSIFAFILPSRIAIEDAAITKVYFIFI